ncbi:MAG: CPBP family intramembrane metalloprotease [Rhodospirillaceae bacterium]|nr:CPBP family intramembrane metalloprotease [Rhodospirillaceae bacterium]
MPGRWTTGTAALAIVVAAFAANAFFNHTTLGIETRAVPGVYPLVFFIGFGVALPPWLMARLARRGPVTARDLGIGAGWRDVIAMAAAFAVASAVAIAPLAPFLRDPAGASALSALFAQLLVASMAEVTLFLGVIGPGLRAVLDRGDDWPTRLVLVAVSSIAFGLFHFTHPAPWNTPALAATVGLIWIGTSLLFVASRSLLAAIIFDNVMAVTGFAARGLAPPTSATIGWLLGGLALAVVALIFAAARVRLSR